VVLELTDTSIKRTKFVCALVSYIVTHYFFCVCCRWRISYCQQLMHVKYGNNINSAVSATTVMQVTETRW